MIPDADDIATVTPAQLAEIRKAQAENTRLKDAITTALDELKRGYSSEAEITLYMALEEIGYTARPVRSRL